MPPTFTSPGYIKLVTDSISDDSVASMTFAQALVQYLASRHRFSAVFIPIDELEPEVLGRALRQCQHMLPIIRGSVEKISALAQGRDEKHLIVWSSQPLQIEEPVLILRGGGDRCQPVELMKEVLPEACCHLAGTQEAQVVRISSEQLAEVQDFPVSLFKPHGRFRSTEL